MVAGVVHGVREVFDDDEFEPVVEIDEDLDGRRLEAVTVHLVPGDPAAGIAIVRRWLL